MIWSLLTVRGYRLSVAAVEEVLLHLSCPKMPDRLLYQSETEQLVLERDIVVAEPEVHFTIFLVSSGTHGIRYLTPNRIQ